MAASLYDQVVKALGAAKASTSCSELTDQLTSLGFEVRDGKRGGHKVFIHDGLPSFTSSSYDCNHGRNPQIKLPYIVKVLRVLREHETELKSFLEG